MNNDKPRKMTDEQRAQRRRAALECANNLNGSDSHYCTQCSTIPRDSQQAVTKAEHTILGQASTNEYIRVHPAHIASALGLGTRKKDFDADELLDLLRKLRDGAVTDSNRIGELSGMLDKMTEARDMVAQDNCELRQRIERAQAKLNSEAERNDVLNEHSKELLGQIVNLTDERDKAQEDLRKALAERNQARAAFRAIAQRMTFEDFCDLILNWGADK